VNINNSCYVYILFTTTCLILSSAAKGDDALRPESEAKIVELVNLLTSLDNSSHVVLSIDCSGSLTNKSAKIAALSFLAN